ncbi:uncharacterized protein TNCV_2981861 [Trichonephila clavipes]|nr:uncharacterized protein TNCV_2981861 [Trichonephila clavipes]
MEVDGMLRIFNRSEKLHNLKYSNYIGDGDTKTFNALSENKPYGDDHLIQKIECVGHVQKRMGTRLRKLKLVYSKKKLSDGKTIGGKGRLTDSLIDKLAHYYGNAIRCNSTNVKEMRKAIWAVWGHSCSTNDEPMHWFSPTNPNTWCKYIYNAAINNNLQNYKHKTSVAKAVRDVIKPVFADLSHPALLKKCLGGKTQNPNESLNSLIWKFCPKTIGSSLQIAEIAANLATSVFNDENQILITILEKFGLKFNRNVCVSLAERDNRRIFTSRQRRLESSFEARRAKKIKRVKKLSCFRNRKVNLTILEHFSIYSSKSGMGFPKKSYSYKGSMTQKNLKTTASQQKSGDKGTNLLHYEAETDHAILNFGQVTRITLELTPLSKHPHHVNRRTFHLIVFSVYQALYSMALQRLTTPCACDHDHSATAIPPYPTEYREKI